MNLHIFKIILYENCTGLTSVTIPNSVTNIFPFANLVEDYD